jgi:predicted Zn-dependent protease
MKDHFFALAERLTRAMTGNEIVLCYLSAERSDFVRFNKSRVRQAGAVEQIYLSIRLVSGRRQASATITLSNAPEDTGLALATLTRLRETVSQLPDDPWLLIADKPVSTDTVRRGRLPAAGQMIDDVVKESKQVDLAGFHAAGVSYRAFANSLGQRNWHEVDTFNMDWSLHLHADKAVKASYGGTHWDSGVFAGRLRDSVEKLQLLEAPARTLQPAAYRAYLAPDALGELTGLLEWNAFSVRARKTRQSALMRMDHGDTLSPKVSMIENVEAGVGPAFQADGFAKPASVILIDHGRLAQSLVSPRSAKEYGIEANGASGAESPEALEILPGGLAEDDVLRVLDTGLYIGNLWYLNFSDRAAGRITGMTRFGTFWVEGGRIVAPVNVLRFDDTIYRMLGENLIDLTRTQDMLLSTWTYGERSTASSRLPGALLTEMRFTL